MESQKQQSPGEWAVEHSEVAGKNTTDLEARFAHIKGWGIDADPENEPTYPMKHWNGDDHKRLNYKRPTQQSLSVEKLHSNERPSVSAVFGAATPPSRLSGQLRRQAFRFSEGNWNHWLTLLLADRVNMIEGIVDDMKKGHFPNIIRERGWTAEWKYNRVGLIKNVAIAAISIGLVVLLTQKKKASARRKIAR